MHRLAHENQKAAFVEDTNESPKVPFDLRVFAWKYGVATIVAVKAQAE